MQNISVSDFLKREKNNLDIFRIIAASMVIFGHAFILHGEPGLQDPIKSIFGFTYSAALAVKIFFFISGLVVTNSLIQSNSYAHFIISRSFRIFPALIFVTLITAFIIGPIVTETTTSQYFNHEETYRYVYNNLILKTYVTLPAVFYHNTFPYEVNSCLWTLPYEAGCYLFLLSLFFIGVLKNKKVANIIFGLIIIESLMTQGWLTHWTYYRTELVHLPAAFSTGAILALNKDKLSINILQTLGFIILTFLFRYTHFVQILLYLSVFSLIVNLSALPSFLKLKIKNDISYGIYLWGFVIQQTIQYYLPELNIYVKILLALILAYSMGYISWILIEKRCINYGKTLISKFKPVFDQ